MSATRCLAESPQAFSGHGCGRTLRCMLFRGHVPGFYLELKGSSDHCPAFRLIQRNALGVQCGSVGEHVLSVHKALASVISTSEKPKNHCKHTGCQDTVIQVTLTLSSHCNSGLLHRFLYFNFFVHMYYMCTCV